MGASQNIPPPWIGNAGIVWSTELSHVENFLTASKDVESIPHLLQKAQERLDAVSQEKAFLEMTLSKANVAVTNPSADLWRSIFAEDLPATDIVAWGKSKIADLQPGLAEIQKIIGQRTGELKLLTTKLTNAQATMDIAKCDMADAWRKLFSEEIPGDPQASWKDDEGHSYYLYSGGRVVFDGSYKAILAPH